MKYSSTLVEFMATGRFPRLWLGMTYRQVKRVLGKSDFICYMDDDPARGLYNYGDMQLVFEGGQLDLILIEYGRCGGLPSIPYARLGCRSRLPSLRRQRLVRALLERHGLKLRSERYGSTINLDVIGSGWVTSACFDNGWLICMSASSR